MKLTIIYFALLFFTVSSYGALSESTCATLVVAELKTQNPKITGAQETEMVTYWTLICKGILDHIKAAAVVNTTTTSVVTTPDTINGTGTGTGTGTVQ